MQGIVQGIRFLGAGAIIVLTAEQKNQVLTTAASIWATPLESWRGWVSRQWPCCRLL
ncbi:hypothetical protein ACGYJ8_17030 [Sulfitobacter sp. 1A12126]|uniref:hypothetical protein n=1 Tax=Sulfitobacter sp. 1A12126 TaxID=3368591 RepID=UPI003746F05B